jgi:hypothetical protein
LVGDHDQVEARGAEGGHTPTGTTEVTRKFQLIGFNTDKAAVRLGVSLSWGAAA